MFRSHVVNSRLFFTQPSLAFFDATNFKPRRTINLTPANYIAELEKNIKPEWIFVPQPRPPSAVHYLIVNKTNSKVMGRLRPPLCVPFPRKHSGFSLLDENNNNKSNSSSSSQQQVLTSLNKDHLLDFFARYEDNIPSTWLLACSDRAIGTCLIDKRGNVCGDMMNFSLLCTQNRQNPGTSMSTSSTVSNNKNNNNRQQQNSSSSESVSNNKRQNLVNLSNEYDSPGFVRPGQEAPIWAELFSWINANHDETLIRCCNWIGRRDDWSNNVMWDDLKAMQRNQGREQRYNDRVAEAASKTATGDDDDEDSTSGSASKAKKYFEENAATATGGHEEGSKEASLYRSQLALERRTVMDNPKWLVVPPSMMPRSDFVRNRTPDEVNTIGAVGRLRMGFLDFV